MNYLNTIAAGKKTIALITAIVFVLSIALSFLHPLEYRSNNRLLLIQPTDTTSDAYGVIKSVERTSENLSQVIYTTSFYDKVMAAGFDIDQTYFKVDEKKKRKQWSKMINAYVVRGSGMLQVEVYHEQQAQALELNRAIAYTLGVSGGLEYLGNRNIQIKEVDAPLVSKWPVRPNFILNGMMGIILGFLIGMVYLLLGIPSWTMPKKTYTPFSQEVHEEEEDLAYEHPTFDPYALPDMVVASENIQADQHIQYNDIEHKKDDSPSDVRPDNYTYSENDSGMKIKSMHDYMQ